MSHRQSYRLPLAALILCGSALNAVALPTDVGRTADVLTNAIRYQAAMRPTVDRPLARPATIVAAAEQVWEPTPFDPAPYAAGDAAFEIALDPIDLGDRWISPFTDDDVFAVAVAGLDQPTAPDEVLPQTQASSPVHIAALSRVYSDVDVWTAYGNARLAIAQPKAQQAEETSAIALAAVAVTTGEDGVASSSRDLAGGASELMEEMADADDNLIMRDGGEDGVDTIMMSSDVLFAFGKAELASDALATLASLGRMETDVAVLEVFGHTDAIGSADQNLALGQRRAEAVRSWLLENTAFTADRIVATGIGEVDPVAPNVTETGNDNPEGRAQNRRVEFAFHDAEFTAE